MADFSDPLKQDSRAANIRSGRTNEPRSQSPSREYIELAIFEVMTSISANSLKSQVLSGSIVAVEFSEPITAIEA
ncbi:hypothetical protein DSO57_1011816 [Entomophthora muscae]|uniref:Uncharacterized protein n=1 Tax=Entomophthora muscae TaxID=34485 RepID=A0ACC2UGZ8_9FUNG|nr:hypothetical protein DSO57_1011816 [Entomophthora muscae]